MDLLDSILNGMEKPPTVKKPVIKDKEKREKFEKMQKERREAARKQKEALDKFRQDLSNQLKNFVNTPITNESPTYKLELKPMNKIYRTIVREVGEDYDEELVIHSFGEEEEDRHCVIWKRGMEPCDEEIRVMKMGLEYRDPRLAVKEEEDDDGDNDDADESTSPVAGGSKTSDGKDKFWQKYEKIIGENASGLESARVALPAKQYGCVPIENKKDQRSIEQILEDKRKVKKLKTGEDEKEPGDGLN